MTPNTPRYTHDCDQCQFLGCVGKYDLYYCPRSDEGSGIARYGNVGSEYASMGFLDRTIKTIRQEIGGLTDRQAQILAIFRSLPGLILNMTLEPTTPPREGVRS